MYVTNVDLIEALLDSHEHCQLTQQCLLLFDCIIEQRIKVFLKYSIEQHYEPMKDHCQTKLERVWQNYKFDQDNAFAYFVTIVDNSIKQYYMLNDLQIVSFDQMTMKIQEQ